MPIVNNSRLLLSILSIVIFLAGCFNQKTSVEKMYDVLEKVVSSEKGFEEQQEPLVSLEKKEKAVYDQIIGLGMKQYNQIVTLSDKGLSMVEKRKVLMQKETDSLKESEKEFKKVAAIKNELDDPVLKKMANELYDIMMQRYQAHDVLYKEYTNGLKNDKQLYRMLKNKNLTFDELESQVVKVNKTYKQIFDANENFNRLTEEYNNKKLAFYKEAGLKLK